MGTAKTNIFRITVLAQTVLLFFAVKDSDYSAKVQTVIDVQPVSYVVD